MTRINDTLLDRFAHSEAPRAYSFEVKAMAQEILERRAAERAAAAAKSPTHQPGLPWPQGTYP